MKSVTIIGVDLQILMQTLEMLRHINVPFESNIRNVIIVDSQSMLNSLTTDSLVTKAHITISILNSNHTISVTLRLVNNTAISGGSIALTNRVI